MRKAASNRVTEVIKVFNITSGMVAICLLAAGLLTSVTAQAFYSTMDTADVLQPGNYEAQVSGQVLPSPFGMNAVGRFDFGTAEFTNLRVLIGTGQQPFQIGGFLKWVPIPDYRSQPGLGLMAGAIYDVDPTYNSTIHFRLHPLASKHFIGGSLGEITPYVSVPLGMAIARGSVYFPVQLTVGAKWIPKGFKHVGYWIEGGLSINDAFSYATFGLSVAFDGENGFRFD